MTEAPWDVTYIMYSLQTQSRGEGTTAHHRMKPSWAKIQTTYHKMHGPMRSKPKWSVKHGGGSVMASSQTGWLIFIDEIIRVCCAEIITVSYLFQILCSMSFNVLRCKYDQIKTKIKNFYLTFIFDALKPKCHQCLSNTELALLVQCLRRGLETVAVIWCCEAVL